jgi:tRNA (guanine37-N1)-methyltransferase
MKIYYISIFPEIFDSFLKTSLIWKAVEKWLIDFEVIDPRRYCTDKHRQIDDEPYWWWAWLVMKAQPIIDAIKSITTWLDNFCIVSVEPSEEEFVQKTAHDLSGYESIIFVCWRYEWIDHRVELWCAQQFWKQYKKLSLGKFVTLWWETPAMVMSESIVRLLPWVIKEEESRKKESYRPEKGWANIEHPHYTRPQQVEGLLVPQVLLSWDHAKIEEWRACDL